MIPFNRVPLALAALVTSLGLVAGCTSRPAQPASSVSPAATASGAATTRGSVREARMAWWRDAKFGMFIHWGVYSVPAGTYNGKQVPGIGEWIMLRGKIPVADYRAFAGQFNPTKYDPGAWAELAADAGMRYVVITHKHHDGFAMFDSAASDWNVVRASPYGRDLIAPLASAVRAKGLHFGAYYSQAQDWNNPGGAKSGNKSWDPAQDGDYDQYLDKVAVPQVQEIMDKFHPEILWWDTPVNMTPERAAKFKPILDANPMLITNNRLGGGEQGDCKTPEQYIPATGLDYDFEVCMTMNDTWGYKSYDHHWKSTRDLIRKLSDISSKGGNFLLNVGPTSAGEIPPESVVRLKAIGRWMKVNGDAIYGTTASPFRKLPWGRATVKPISGGGSSVFLHVWNWPEDGVLLVPGLRTTPKSVTVLGSQAPGAERGPAIESPSETVVADGIRLRLPRTAPEADVSVVRLDFAGTPEIVPVLARPDADGQLVLDAVDTDVSGRKNDGLDIRGDWVQLTAPNSHLTYAFELQQAGRYNITLSASGLDGQTFSVETPAGVMPSTLPPAAKPDSFRNIPLGLIELPAGKVTITLRPVAEGWKPIRVKTVTVKRAQ